MIISSKQILNKARKQGFAVPHFNTVNLETTLAILKAAKNTPLRQGFAGQAFLIIATSEGEAKYSNPEIIADLVKKISDEFGVKVALHLDHGKDINIIKQCIKAGYSSIHFDGSELPYTENVKKTKQIVALCKKKKVQVEGELGRVLTPKDGEKVERKDFFTDPDQAQDFVKKTGIDSLAIAIGTAHGPYKGKTKLDLARLKEISRKLKTPLVLHGGSLVPKDQLKKAIKLGIAKVNINTELRQAFANGLKESFKKNPSEITPYKFLAKSQDYMYNICVEKIRLF